MSYFLGFLVGLFGAAIAIPVAIFLFFATVLVLGLIAYGLFYVGAYIYSKCAK